MDPDSSPILITGATGSIGFRLAQRLSVEGRRVRAVVRDPARAGRLHDLPDCQVVQGDLSVPTSLHGCMQGCSQVYHCAAKLLGSDPAKFKAVNVEGTRALLEEADRARVVRFIHVSTIGVYACCDASNVREDYAFPKSRSQYFSTKQEAERAVWAAVASVPVAVARLGDVFGPGQYVWTVDLIQKLQRGTLLPPTDGETGFFNPVYIDNAIDALILIGTHPAALGQAFNVVDGTPMRFSEYIRWLATVAGRRTFAVPGFVMKTGAATLMVMDLLRGQEASVKPDGVDYLLHKGTISGEKIRAMLGWRPAVDREEAFRRTEQWLRAEGLVSPV